MSEQAPENPTPAPGPEQQQANPEAPAQPTDQPDTSKDQLPEWARKSLDKANQEAANYRTQLREAQKALANAKTPDEFEKVVGDLNTKLLDAERKLLIRDHTEGLPKELIEAPWVNWPTDEDGIKGVATQLRELVAKQQAEQQEPPATGGTLSGGLNPGAHVDETDPLYWGKRLRERHR